MINIQNLISQGQKYTHLIWHDCKYASLQSLLAVVKDDLKDASQYPSTLTKLGCSYWKIGAGHTSSSPNVCQSFSKLDSIWYQFSVSRVDDDEELVFAR